MNILGQTVLPRVGQLDASLLDAELVEQMKNKLWDAFKGFHPEIKDSHEHELLALLKLVLFKITVWDTSTTYGGKLLGLKFVNSSSGKALSRKQKLAYGLVTVLGSYFWTKLDEYLTAASYDSTDRPAIRRLRDLSDNARVIWTAASLFNFVAFLYSGRYSTLILRLLRIRYEAVSRKASRHVNYEFQNRQLVWNAMTEFLLFALPLVSFTKLKRRLLRIVSPGSENSPQLSFLPQRICPICYEKDSDTASVGVTNPYITQCGHVYCYVCIKLKLTDEPDGWPCLRCGQSVTEVKPL